MWVLFILTSFFLFKSGMSDPGILLRGHPNDIKKTNNENKSKPTRIRQLGYIREYKICDTCFLVRPLRSTHCGICDNCVIRFDHHCPWIGSCVGVRNYPYFFIYLCILNIMQIFTAVVSITDIIIKMVKNFKDKDKEINTNKLVQESFGQIIMSLYIFIYICITMIFTTGLLIFHIRIVLNNMTTKEELKKFFIGNPFRREKLKNFLSIICPKRAKMGLINLLNYNQKMYEEQIKYNRKKHEEKERRKKKDLEDNILNDDNKNVKIDDEHINDINNDINIDSKEIFNINNENGNDKNDNNIKNENNINGLKKKHLSISEKNMDENEITSSRDNMIDKIDKNLIENKINKSINSICNTNSEYDDYNVQKSQSYLPDIVKNISINNNVEFHNLPLIREESSKKSDSTKERQNYLQRKNCFKEDEENEISD